MLSTHRSIVEPPYCDAMVLILMLLCHCVVFNVLCISFAIGFPATEPGVSYNITVRASTGVGKGEPVSIIVFTVQQGIIVLMTRYKGFCAKFVYTVEMRSIFYLVCICS